MCSSDLHKREIVQKEKQIIYLTKRLEKKACEADYIKNIERILEENQMLDTKKMGLCYTAVMETFFLKFKDLAARNGFFMPVDNEFGTKM